MDDAPTVIRVFIDSTSDNKSDLEQELQTHFFNFVDFFIKQYNTLFSSSYCPSGPSQPYVSLRASNPKVLLDYLAWAQPKFPDYQFVVEKD